MSDPLLPKFHALVPCAGSGSRAATALPKQYMMLAGAPVIQHTLQALRQVQRLSQLWVVVQPDDDTFATHVPGFEGQLLHRGGLSRAHSVLHGLQAMSEAGVSPTDWVLVHDAARCMLQPAWVNELIDACKSDSVGGLLALPLADSLKVAQSGRVMGGMERSDKWLAQTPQMFRLGRLQEALSYALSQVPQGVVTDEASAMQALGDMPLLVPGSWENFKLTYPCDFDLAQRLLRSRH